MRLSERFDLGRSQWELDFVDIDPDKDTALFIDPYFLGTRTDAWSIDASATVRDFFDHLIDLIRSDNLAEGRRLFSNLHEPNETCLGLSKGAPSGRGIGSRQAKQIFDSLAESRAVETGILGNLEDCRIFVPGIGRDKASDMVTNIIRGHLIDYTHDQCELWDIPLRSDVPSGPIWQRHSHRWNEVHTEMLVVDERRLLLAPKAIVSRSDQYSADKYHRHHVLNFLQNEHLRMDTVLVKKRENRRKKTVTRYVTKKDVEAYEGSADKDYLADFTKKHADIFADFRERAKDRIAGFPNEEISQIGLDEVCDHLIGQVREISPGNTDAHRYHKTIASILELLFFPDLIYPTVEKEIHGARKRIDISFENAAESGFFRRLHNVKGIPCQYIMVECKNYSRDLKNPELDQISGRFSPNRGQFGIAICREISDMKLFVARCGDTFKDGRGAVVPMVDADLIGMLEDLKSGVDCAYEKILSDRFSIVAHS